MTNIAFWFSTEVFIQRNPLSDKTWSPGSRRNRNLQSVHTSIAIECTVEWPDRKLKAIVW